MSIVNVSLDTNTRQVVITINGVLVPFTEFNFSQWNWEGEDRINFSYTTEGTNVDGMKERQQFYLPDPDELASQADISVNEDGFASKAVFDEEKARADVIEYLKRDNKSE